jgi:4-amino-4-deoxy-L-arabinose transferase-like glycosyltransferase
MDLMQPKKSPISIILFLVGGIIVVLGQSLVDKYLNSNRLGTLILIAIGLLFVFFGIWTADKGLPKWLSRVLTWLDDHSIKEWRIYSLLLSLPVACIVPVAAGGSAKMINPFVAIFAWFMAIGLVLAGTWIQVRPLRWPAWRLVALVLGLTAIAFLLRVVRVDRIPIILTGDEASAGIAAEDFTYGKWNNIFITSWYAFPSFFFSIPSFFIGIFGHTTAALRIPSALAGALTVTASFFVARAMFGKRTAWFTAVFLAALHFHIHFSRIGLNNIWDGLWYIVTIGALWYGWEKGYRNAYVLAGLSLGISQYFYPSSRTILVLIIGWIVFAAIFDRPRLKRAWLDLILMLFIAVIISLPLIWHYARNPNTFFEPMDRVALTSSWLKQEMINTGLPAWRVILKQVGLALGSYTYEPLRHWYTPEVPLLRPFAAALFLIGILILFLRRQKWHIVPLMLWLLAFMAIGGLSDSTPASQRYVAAAPVCALLVGYGLSESIELVGNVFNNNKRLVNILSIILVAILAVDELNFYFRVYTPHSVISQARSNPVLAQTLADYLETEPKNMQVVFFGFPIMGYYSIPSPQYLVPEITGIDINQSWSSADKSNITSKHLLFVFLPTNVDQMQPVQVDHPGGKLTSIQAADGELLYKMYEVSTSP